MSVLSAVTYYLDEDADGFGISSASISTCSIPSGYSVNSNDCNDNDNTINPGVNEQCWNQLDDNCNGAVDENCAILGCVDPVACNFNPQANQSDNSCQYPPNYYNCEGNCIVDTDGDGVCDQLEVLGCTLSNACNFNPLATELDGSCILPQPEICNGIDDNCNGLTDEGVTVNSVTAVNAITKLYPTCSGSNMLAANLNLGSNSPITEGDGLDLWYRLTAQRNSLRAALSAATGVNAVEIYQQVGSCMQLLGSEQEVGVSNQTLYYDDLVVGNEYFVVCRNLSGPANTSAKICFNHFDGTTCDHVYSGNTGVYSNVCVSFKAVYKANVANYVFNVNSASSAGNSISIVPWTYVTPTSSSIITRIGTLLPANFTASPITYGLTIGVTYVLQDAAGNTHYISADGTTPCTATLNPELPVALRATDRCPNIKAINNSIATDRQICGASRYEWEFTQLLPTPSTALIVQGGLNTNVLFLNAVPGMANGKTYNVRVRSRHSSGSIGEWGPSHCLKTTGSGMILEPELESFLSLSQGNEGVSVYPNPYRKFAAHEYFSKILFASFLWVFLFSASSKFESP